jgi:hypothetical protein
MHVQLYASFFTLMIVLVCKVKAVSLCSSSTARKNVQARSGVLSLALYNLKHKEQGVLEGAIKTHHLSGMWCEMFGLQQMVELLILDVQEDPQTSEGSL